MNNLKLCHERMLWDGVIKTGLVLPEKSQIYLKNSQIYKQTSDLTWPFYSGELKCFE